MVSPGVMLLKTWMPLTPSEPANLSLRTECDSPAVLLTLRYLAKGDFFSEVGDIHGVSKSSMSRHLHDVVLAINNRVDTIRFPEIDVERRSTATAFYRLSRIPRVLGAIDCTLIPISTPTTHEASYVCRKGYHALNVQAVVDTKLRFIDAVLRWPGATNDATFFEMSGLKDYLEANAVGVLLGDSGYALRNYLLTPILRPTANAQVAYNDAHARGRVVVERAFGVLKSRFRCLHRSRGCLMFSPAKCQQIVICCMKLHNLCIDNGLDFNEQVIQDD
ncbi:putative nuclease HARBI1 [Mya arenaria]|uniref:putative nuclease HARBI1 n=1 Tax=Mya arenaria TaxID=6604 RepID=UPI0022E62A13|nr:putative nuclease HARBI1 [Mya arenaria]